MDILKPIETVTASITHAGARAVVVHTLDGTLTVQPGQKLRGQEILPLTEEKVDYYKSLGVKITGAVKPDAANAVDVSELESAVADAQSAYNDAKAASEKPGAGDAEKDALKVATDELSAAQADLAKARAPVRKAGK